MAADMSEARDEQWELNHLHVLIYDEIGMCGCGWGDDAYTLVRDLLDHFHDRDERDVIEMTGSAAAAQIVLYRIQDADLIDHGTSATSSWITDKGRYARWLMHKHPRLVEHAGYPDCWDHDRDGCPDECWVPPDDVPPEPERPSMDELLERARQESEALRSRMNPVERVIADEVDEQMTNYLLYGQHPAPEVSPTGKFTGFAGHLDDAVALEPLVKPARDRPPEAFTPQGLSGAAVDRAIRDMWESTPCGPSPMTDPPGGNTATGLFDALGGVTPGSRNWPPEPDSTQRLFDRIIRDGEAANGPLPRAQWAPATCICPWPWPLDGEHVRLDCPLRREPAKPVVGRSAYTECHRIDGTWVHSKPHDGCPTWTRGR